MRRKSRFRKSRKPFNRSKRLALRRAKLSQKRRRSQKRWRSQKSQRSQKIFGGAG